MSIKKKRVAVLGSTGSIGQRALNIISSYPERFELKLISCNSNKQLFEDQTITKTDRQLEQNAALFNNLQVL